MKELVNKILAVGKEIVIVNFAGWYRIARQLADSVREAILGSSLQRIVFLAASILMIGFALLPWIEYKVNLMKLDPMIRVGSNFKVLFILPGAFGLVAALFKFPPRIRIYFALYGIIFLLFVIAYFFPKPIHTSILHRGDYQFTLFLYIYGVLMLGAGATCKQALANPTVDPAQLMDIISHIPDEPL